MSLRWYGRPRMVVLNSSAPVLDAARAIEQNRIGAVVVQDKGRVVGIVTDRDLAVRALARGLAPATTRIAEVMTPAPVVLAPGDAIADAVRLMQERNIRRIPLVEGDRVMGMVTLDDLLLDEAAPLEELAAIVQAQIADGGPAGSPRHPRRLRSLARSEATLTRFLAEVHRGTGLEDPAQSRLALDIVLSSLVRRLVPQEARDFIAQLPSLLQPELRALPPGPDKAITEASVQAELGAALRGDRPSTAQILAAVAGVVAGSISEGQAENVRSQLPKGLRDVFESREIVPLFI